MVLTLRTPGAYFEHVDAGGDVIAPLRSDVTGFVGIAERGPIDRPVPLQSWRQFVSWFGDVIPTGFLGYAVRGFFANGGRRCWVVRVASKDDGAGAACAGTVLVSASGPVWRVRASSEGAWGNRLGVSVRELSRVQVRAVASDPDGMWTVVPGVAGIARGLHVRLSQPGTAPALRVVSDVDPLTGRVYWVNPDDRRRLPHDAPVVGLDLTVPVLFESVEYRLTVEEEGVLVAAYDRLSLVPENERYAPSLLSAPLPLAEASQNAASWAPPQPIVVDELREDPGDLSQLILGTNSRVLLSGGRSGLAPLTPYDFCGEPAATSDSRRDVDFKSRGIRTLEPIGEIGLLAVPDAFVRPVPVNPVMPPEPRIPDLCLCEPIEPRATVITSDADLPPAFTDQQAFSIQAQLVDQCERLRYRFALLDPPLAAATDLAGGIGAVLDWRARFESTRAALSYPWLGVVDPLGANSVRLVPPSGHIAGRYAATDLGSGVHRAAANTVVDWALSASLDLDATRHGLLNDAGVNVVRTVSGRGLRLLGARTVSGDPDWRFVPVRRLLSMVEKALETALQWAIFEPNGVLTRARVVMSVTFFMLGLHESGAFAGATPEESFRVICGPENNPARATDIGELIVEVQIAPVVPLEFVLVRVGRVGESLVVRSGAAPASTFAGGVS